MVIRKVVSIVVKGQFAQALQGLKQIEDQTDGVSGAADNLGASFTSAFGPLAVGGAITTAVIAGISFMRSELAAMRRETEEMAQVSAQFGVPLTELAALTGRFGPELQNQINQAAIDTGRDPALVAAGLNRLESLSGNLNDTQRNALFQESLQSSILSPSVPLERIGSNLAQVGRTFGETDFNFVQNALRITEDLGGATADEIGRFFPAVAGAVGAGGGDLGIAGGLFAGATANLPAGLGGELARVAAQRLSAPTSDASSGLFQQFGFQNRDIGGNLQRLLAADPSDADLITLFGEKGLSTFEFLQREQSTIFDTAGSIRGSRGRDVTGERIGEIFQDPLISGTRGRRSASARLSASRQNAGALFRDSVLDNVEAFLNESGDPTGREQEIARGFVSDILEANRSTGPSADLAAKIDFALRRASLRSPGGLGNEFRQNLNRENVFQLISGDQINLDGKGPTKEQAEPALQTERP